MTEVVIGEGPVLLSLNDGVADLRLNRPDASNAMDIELLRALHGALLRCQADPRIRAVILSGNGPSFCAGGDVKAFAAQGERLPDYLREATAWLQAMTTTLIHLRAPVIAAVHGHAAGGGGFGLVCACDLVVAAETARFLTGATRVGMAPDAGTTVTLPRIVGIRKAMELLMTNPTLTAAEAQALGIVNRVVPDAELRSAAEVLAGELASGAAQALAETKRLLWDGVGRSVEQCLPDEANTVVALGGTADAHEGLAAVIERRPASFEGVP